MISVGFLQEFTFWIAQNHKPVIDGMNGLSKQRIVTSVLTFGFSTFYTNTLPHSKRLMVVNSLIDFCFDGGESKYITVNNCGTHWVKNIKDNVICLNKQQIKYAVAYMLCNVISLLALRSSAKLLVFLWGLIQLLFCQLILILFWK